MPKHPTIPRICSQCGSPFLARSWAVKQGKARFCSPPCAVAGRKQPIPERFWSRVDRSRNCWEWQGGRTKDGYGQVSIDGKIIHAHRVAWMLTNGEIPTGHSVLHHCDNPPCVRPDHLFLGTQLDNMRDCADKGRITALRGEASGVAKLAAPQVQEIRVCYRRRTHTLHQLAARYGVTTGAIQGIVYGRTWRHLPWPNVA